MALAQVHLLDPPPAIEKMELNLAHMRTTNAAIGASALVLTPGHQFSGRPFIHVQVNPNKIAATEKTTANLGLRC